LIKTDRVIIVEGKYDKIKLSSVVDALIIETNGFGIFKDKEKLNLIKMLAQKRGIIILTDSDSAGFLIRNHLKSVIAPKYITHIYIPDIYGKERRKASYSKEGKLGVEGIDINILREAFEKAGVMSEETERTSNRREITRADFYDFGLCGTDQSAVKRKKLQRKLKLPEHLSQKALLEVLNCVMDYYELEKNMREI